MSYEIFPRFFPIHNQGYLLVVSWPLVLVTETKTSSILDGGKFNIIEMGNSHQTAISVAL